MRVGRAEAGLTVRALVPLVLAACASAPPEPVAGPAPVQPAVPEKVGRAVEPAVAVDSGAGARTVLVDAPAAASQVDQRIVTIVTAAMLEEARRFPGRFFGRGDLNAMLSEQKRRDLVGCSEVACLGDLGGAAGADSLIFGELTGYGQTLYFSVSLMDVKTMTVTRSQMVEIHSMDGLRGAVASAMKRLLAAP